MALCACHCDCLRANRTIITKLMAKCLVDDINEFTVKPV